MVKLEMVRLINPVYILPDIDLSGKICDKIYSEKLNNLGWAIFNITQEVIGEILEKQYKNEIRN